MFYLSALFFVFLLHIRGQSEHETISELLSVLRYGLSPLFGNNFVLHNTHKPLHRFGIKHVCVCVCGSGDTRRVVFDSQSVQLFTAPTLPERC